MTGESGLAGRHLPTVDPSWLAVPTGVLGAVLVVLYAPLPAEMATMLAITVFSICLWIGTPVAPWFTGLLAVGLVGTQFSTDLALVGFRSAATWLIVLGILLGAATRESGLAGTVEAAVLRRMPDEVAGDPVATYRYLLGVLSVAALVFAVLVPSSLVRVLILGPILASVGELFTDRRARLGLFFGPLFVTYYGGTGVFTGSLANIIISGIVESNAGVSIGWVEWGLWMGPLMAVGRMLTIVAIAYVRYRPGPESDVVPSSEFDGTVEFGTDQRRMLGFLLLGVAVWATDSIHGLHPLYGALLVVLLTFAPRLGVVDPSEVGDIDFSIVFYIGAIFAIAAGLRQTGFTDLIARGLLSYLPGDASLGVVLAFVVVVSIALTFVMEGLAVASVLTPILVSFTASAGIPIEPVAMMEAAALNTYFFPYQSAVLVGILSLDVVDSVELVGMATLCSLATLLVLMPIQIALFVLLF